MPAAVNVARSANGEVDAVRLSTKSVGAALSPEQVAELNQKLSKLRHDINNNLAMMLAAAELAKLKPELAAKMLDRVIEQPAKITEQIKDFSVGFEKSLGITRP